MEPCYPSENLQNDELILKRVHVDFVQTIYELVSKNRKYLGEFLPWIEGINSLEDEKESIGIISKRWDEQSMFDYMIFIKDSDTYIGNIGIHTINWSINRAELGYWIGENFQGNGYVTKACRILEQELFKMGFHRIQICCSDKNTSSSKVPERLGYIYEGTLRENAIVNGAYRNTKYYSKLKTD